MNKALNIPHLLLLSNAMHLQCMWQVLSISSIDLPVNSCMRCRAPRDSSSVNSAAWVHLYPSPVCQVGATCDVTPRWRKVDAVEELCITEGAPPLHQSPAPRQRLTDRGATAHRHALRASRVRWHHHIHQPLIRKAVTQWGGDVPPGKSSP